MQKLQLIANEGWVLVNLEIDLMCHKCLKKVKNFYFCKENNQIFCKSCEKNQFCRQKKEEHEHFHIISIKK